MQGMQIDTVEGTAEKDKEDLRAISILAVMPRFSKASSTEMAYVLVRNQKRVERTNSEGCLSKRNTATISKGLAKAIEVVCLVIEPATMLWIILVVRNISGLSVSTYVM